MRFTVSVQPFSMACPHPLSLWQVSRYSAYSSDVGEAFRPIAPPMVVNASYAIAFGYVGLDIAYNGYRASEEKRSVPRALAHASIFQVCCRMVAFGTPPLLLSSAREDLTIGASSRPPPLMPNQQGLASLLAPYAIIHTQVSVAQSICKRINRFQRWGPTVAGLALIPLLPSLVDEPIEHAVEWGFDTYWPEKGHAPKPHGKED